MRCENTSVTAQIPSVQSSPVSESALDADMFRVLERVSYRLRDIVRYCEGEHPSSVELYHGFSKAHEDLALADATLSQAEINRSSRHAQREQDQDFVDMLWKWFEDRGCDLRAERWHGLTADDFRVMLDEHEAALLDTSATSPAQCQQQWQPIETAPRNRTVVGWCVFPAGAEDRLIRWFKDAFYAYGVRQNVTHWMERPPAPSDSSTALNTDERDDGVIFNGRVVSWEEIEAAVQERNARLSQSSPEGGGK